MTIYDVPVDDTKFFPVSGDMMRQMKHDEDLRLAKQNDTGDPAKNPSDAVNSNPLKGQAMLHVSLSHNDLVVHPTWCDPEQCIDPDTILTDDPRLHRRHLGYAEAREGQGLEIALIKFDGEEPGLHVGDADMDLERLENLILLLDCARTRLIEATGTGYTLTNAGRDALERED